MTTLLELQMMYWQCIRAYTFMLSIASRGNEMLVKPPLSQLASKKLEEKVLTM